MCATNKFARQGDAASKRGALVVFSAILARLSLTLWVGGLWIVGYLVAPVLFASLPTRLLAGEVAGQLFGWMGWIGVGCGVYLLAYHYSRQPQQTLRSWRFVALCLMLLLSVAQLFWLQPVIAQIKAELGPLVASGDRGGRFAFWHGVSALTYLLQSLLGAALVAVNAFAEGRDETR
ncbi:MAG: DUF4149 domain-containing protein [Betaproteobacteria bacterium]|nr:DUF4149 domain-containing protein [Betaproteobacteria bacterium]